MVDGTLPRVEKTASPKEAEVEICSRQLNGMEELGLSSGPSRQTYALPSAVDRPCGQYISVPSGVTGKPLRYFIPDSLGSLLERCRMSRGCTKLGHDDLFMGLLLAREASKYGRNKIVDVAQAARFCQLIVGPARQYKTVHNLIELGRSVSNRSCGLRNRMVFSGSNSASAAQHIYAPYSAVPELMSALAEGINGDLSPFEPAVAMSLIEYFAVHVHPFDDGNGRWARLVATSVGMKIGSSLQVMASATFHNLLKKELADTVWPTCANSGMRRYLEMSLAFECEFLRQMAAAGILTSIQKFNNEILATTKKQHSTRHVLSLIFSDGNIGLDRFRSMLGISNRVFEGAMERISATSETDLIRNDRIDLASILDSVSKLADRAKECVLSRVVS